MGKTTEAASSSRVRVSPQSVLSASADRTFVIWVKPKLLPRPVNWVPKAQGSFAMQKINGPKPGNLTSSSSSFPSTHTLDRLKVL